MTTVLDAAALDLAFASFSVDSRLSGDGCAASDAWMHVSMKAAGFQPSNLGKRDRCHDFAVVLPVSVAGGEEKFDGSDEEPVPVATFQLPAGSAVARPLKSAKSEFEESPFGDASPVRSCLKRSRRSDGLPCAGGRVQFAPDVKAHDGLRPASIQYDTLVMKCLAIGGMATCEDLIAFMAKTAAPFGDFRLFYDDVEALVHDLSSRLAACPEGVPILAEGGGSNSKISAAAVPNVDHLKLVLTETKRRMAALGVYPIPAASASPASPPSVSSSALSCESEAADTPLAVGGCGAAADVEDSTDFAVGDVDVSSVDVFLRRATGCGSGCGVDCDGTVVAAAFGRHAAPCVCCESL